MISTAALGVALGEGSTCLVAAHATVDTASTNATAQATATEAGSGYVTQEDDDEFPLGLLGLLGLAGLLGLKRKDDDRVNRASTTDRR